MQCMHTSGMSFLKNINALKCWCFAAMLHCKKKPGEMVAISVVDGNDHHCSNVHYFTTCFLNCLEPSHSLWFENSRTSVCNAM